MGRNKKKNQGISFLLCNLVKEIFFSKTTSQKQIFVRSHNFYKEEKIQVIVQHWIRILHVKLGWINEFDKLIINYVSSVFMFETFRSSSKLINITGQTGCVRSIDYSTFDDRRFICSGSEDKTVRVWDVDNNKHIKSFNEHSSH
ncbi:hypothetical protein RFI_01472, partial [Reticulomyxa filosa]